MRRVYTSTAQFRAPFDSPMLSLSGLGAYPSTWPRGRSYNEVAWFRSPYVHGSGLYFGDNSLQGAAGVASGVAYGIGGVLVGALGGVIGGLMLAETVAPKHGGAAGTLAGVGALIGAGVGAVMGYRAGKAKVDG